MVKLSLEKLASAASVSVTGEWKMNGEKKKAEVGENRKHLLEFDFKWFVLSEGLVFYNTLFVLIFARLYFPDFDRRK